MSAPESCCKQSRQAVEYLHMGGRRLKSGPKAAAAGGLAGLPCGSRYNGRGTPLRVRRARAAARAAAAAG